MQCSLPTYDFEKESDEVNRLITECITRSCKGFSKGRCFLVCPPTCFFYHSAKHKRREVVGPDGRVLYWDKFCDAYNSLFACSKADSCEFAHSKTEVTYHPSRFRTQLCNDVECRGSVCCFAHSPGELRSEAYSQYSWDLRFAREKHSECFSLRCDSDDASTVTSSSPSSRTSRLYMITRLCATFPNDIDQCPEGEDCGFAHSVMELLTPLLDPGVEDFYPLHFKTQWCPCDQVHAWTACLYGHNWSEMRRPPSIGYGPLMCSAWAMNGHLGEYIDRCPNGLRCPYAHGKKESMYHPALYKVERCVEWRGPLFNCSRGESCAQYHEESERRSRLLDVCFDYSKLLRADLVENACAHMFTKPLIISAANIRAANKEREDLNIENFFSFALAT